MCVFQRAMIGCLGLSIAASVGHAQQRTESGVLEEIVVTAQKREESLQDVPMSIAVLTGDRLEAANVDNLFDLPNAIPGFDMAPGDDSKDASPRIRGIGTISYSNAIEPSVATVVDGVVLGRQGMNLFNFDDIDRVEVLRGPQGTLFGLNSTAGVLNIVTKDPTDVFTGKVGLHYGSHDRRRFSGALSGPIVENRVLGRLSFYSDERDGYVHNVFTGQDLNWDDQKSARGKLLFLPREQTRLTLIGEVADQDRSTSFGAPIAPSNNPDAAGLYPFARPGNDLMNGIGEDQGAENQLEGGSLIWEESLGDFTLTSITAYRAWDHLIDHGVSSSPLVDTFNKIFYESSQKQWSQELRLASPIGDRLDYVIGMFLFDQNVKAFTDLRLNVVSVETPVYIRAIYDEDVDLLNVAGFGELNFHVSDQLMLLAGARWSKVELDAHVEGFPAPPGEFQFLVPVGVMEDSVTDTKWSGRVGARWQLTQEHTLYTTLSRGFKPSAFNTVSSTGDLQQVEPEIPTSIEVGWKSQILDNRLRFNLATFHTTFKDFQAQQAFFQEIVPGEPPRTFFILQNAGELETQGVEFELEALPVDSLTVHFSASYIDAVFDDYRDVECFPDQTIEEGCINGVQDLSGTTLPYVPKLSMYTSARYDVALNNLPFDAFVDANYSWRDDVQWSINNNPDNIEEAYGLLGASVGISDRDGRYELRVYGENLTDQTHGQISGGGSRSMGTSPALTQRIPPDYRRIYGLTFEYNFGAH